MVATKKEEEPRGLVNFPDMLRCFSRTETRLEIQDGGKNELSLASRYM